MSTSDPTPWASVSIDPTLTDPDSVLEYETELVWGRKAFSSAQAYFAQFAGVDKVYDNVQINWHGTGTDLNEGSFAVVRTGSPLQDLVGDVLRVFVGTRSVFAYCCAESSLITTDISLARRAFMAVGLLATSPNGLRGKIQVCL